MTPKVVVLGWICVAIDALIAAALFFGRSGGDAATRGLGQGLGVALAALGAVAAGMLVVASRDGGRTLVAALGAVLAAAPLLVAVVLTVSNNAIGWIYPSMRGIRKDGDPVRYEYPDQASREAALALLMNDYARVDSLLRATPSPDLSARDERGQTLLGLAVGVAVSGIARPVDIEGLRLVLAAGAKPVADAIAGDETLVEYVAGANSPRAAAVMEILLDAGLDPNAPMRDGRSALFHPYLRPDAARVLLARGVDRMVHDTRGGALDWSPVTYQADLRNWEVARILLDAGVPLDHGTPAGSVLQRVVTNNLHQATDEELADSSYQAVMAAVSRTAVPSTGK